MYALILPFCVFLLLQFSLYLRIWMGHFSEISMLEWRDISSQQTFLATLQGNLSHLGFESMIQKYKKIDADSLLRRINMYHLAVYCHGISDTVTMKTSPCLLPYLWWKPNLAGTDRNQRHSDKILKLDTFLNSVDNEFICWWMKQ